jgi:hypothetical protein
VGNYRARRRRRALRPDGPDLAGRHAGRPSAEGVAGVLTGIITFAWPGITTLVLLWVIAAWAVVTGVMEIMVAVRLRRELRGERPPRQQRRACRCRPESLQR